MGKVNINTAGLEELDNIPGIGPALAQRIIDYRSNNGFFSSPEDLKNVSGIGDKTYEKMSGYLTVGQ
jgi:competence protein ComEA